MCFYKIYLYYDVEMSLNQIEYNKKNTYIYYSNYIYIVNVFFNESKLVYNHILSSLGLTNVELMTYMNVYNKYLKKPMDINLDNFYKNINHKQPWIL